MTEAISAPNPPKLLDRVRHEIRLRHLPVVLTREEVSLVLGRLSGSWWLMGMLLYGGGLRQIECLRLRVKDVDFGQYEILVPTCGGGCALYV